MNVKKQIITMLSRTDRDGMPALIEYLEAGSDFFEAPASTKHHHVYRGGLATHSLEVYHTLVTLSYAFGRQLSRPTAAIVSLLHDVCKTNYYVPENAWRKDDRGKWESYTRWGVNDALPIGHGEKSLFMISKFIALTDEEAAAIRWHMGAWTPGVTTDYGAGHAYNAAQEKYPLVTLLSTADNVAVHLK